jgi:hypothetical protein
VKPEAKLRIIIEHRIPKAYSGTEHHVRIDHAWLEIFIDDYGPNKWAQLHFRASAMDRQMFRNREEAPWLEMKCYDKPNAKKAFIVERNITIVTVKICGGYEQHPPYSVLRNVPRMDLLTIHHVRLFMSGTRGLMTSGRSRGLKESFDPRTTCIPRPNEVSTSEPG